MGSQHLARKELRALLQGQLTPGCSPGLGGAGPSPPASTAKGCTPDLAADGGASGSCLRTSGPLPLLPSLLLACSALDPPPSSLQSSFPTDFSLQRLLFPLEKFQLRLFSTLYENEMN